MNEALEVISNIASILTALIAVLWFFYTRKKYYYLHEIPGNYKIFSNLKDQKSLALYHLSISHISPKGWFYGSIEYSETFKPEGSKSAAVANVFGKLNYQYWRRI